MHYNARHAARRLEDEVDRRVLGAALQRKARVARNAARGV
jgi:hypothetical protein